jgi:outer membrane immunogenic protein
MYEKITRSIALAAIVLFCLGAGGIASAQAAGGHTWTGFYLGAQVGGLWQHANMDCCSNFGFTDHYSGSPSGIGGGGYGGYNFQVQNFVVGAEGDFNLTNASSNGDTFVPCCLVDPSTSWNASLRARAGLIVHDRFLLFVTGGVAFTDFDLPAEAGTGCSPDCNFASGTRVGYTVGAGGEMFVTDSLSVKAEYLYADYGSDSVQYATGSPDSRSTLTSNTVRIGVGWHFN